MTGGSGDDTYIVDSLKDKTIETDVAGSGSDTVMSGVFSINLNAGRYNNIENATLLGKKNLNLTGDSGNNYLEGNSGSNILTGGDGSDSLDGGPGGRDTLRGGAGDDRYIIRDEVDVIEDTEGNNDGLSWLLPKDVDLRNYNGIEEARVFISGNFNVSGTNVSNNLFGNDQNNTLNGFDGNDRLSGFDGNDVLNGGAGDDELFGDRGDDIIHGGTGNDVIGLDFGVNEYIYRLDDLVEGATIFKDTYTGTSAQMGAGSFINITNLISLIFDPSNTDGTRESINDFIGIRSINNGNGCEFFLDADGGGPDATEITFAAFNAIPAVTGMLFKSLDVNGVLREEVIHL